MAQVQSLTAPSPEGELEAQAHRVPLETEIILKFAHFGGFFVEYSANISQTGIFIKTDSPRPAGSVFIFEIWLGDDFKAVHGVGEVMWVREVAEGPERPAGMGVRYLKVDPSSQDVVRRMIDEQIRRGGRVFELTEQFEEGTGQAPELSRVEGRLRRWLVWAALAVAAAALTLLLNGGLLRL